MSEVGETEILAASAVGHIVDCGQGDALGRVDADVIRRCCYRLRGDVDPRGLRLRHASVSGGLDLAGLDIAFPLRFDGCDFDSPLVIEGTQLFELALINCRRVPGLLANGVHVRRDLDLSGSQISGALRTSASTSKRSAIWLCESKIGGRLLCVDTIIDGEGERSVQADRMRVGGNVRLLHQFAARGEVRMIGTRINGSLDLTGARIESPVTGLALDLGEAVIDGSVFLIDDSTGRKPAIHGRIDMGRASIGGQFLVRNATLASQGAIPVGSAYSQSRSAGTALNAPRLSVGAELTFEGSCQVTGGIDLSMSELSNISIGQECTLRAPGQTALNLTNAELLSAATLGPGLGVQGTIRLAGARIHGTLELREAVLSDPERRALVSALGTIVDGDTDLRGLRASGGRITFANATLGTLIAAGAQLSNPGDFTLSLHQATVNGSVVLAYGFCSQATVILSRATIQGRLECNGGTFTVPPDAADPQRVHAIEAISATIRGGMELDWERIDPSVDFTNTVTTFLVDDPGSWPPRFAISGFTYDRFDQPRRDSTATSPAWDHVARCAWLSRQLGYDAGPYEQAARVFRQHGYSDGAEAILIAQRRLARQTIRGRLAIPRRAVDAVYSVTVGYGYRPLRVLWLLIALITLVTGSLLIPPAQATMRAASVTGTIYTTRGPALAPPASGQHRSDTCGNGLVRCFNPLLYAVDTVVPLVSLDQRSTWYPDARAAYGTFMEWWLNTASILGWLLSTVFVLSLARLARSL
jgi:hypothetical protein